jgi:hypothetical protein
MLSSLELTLFFPHRIENTWEFGECCLTDAMDKLISRLNWQQGVLPREQEQFLQHILAPFKLLVLRSAQEAPRLATLSSMRRLPKDMCRMVGDLLGPPVDESGTADSDCEEEE